jgi:hypothetical protein
MRSTADGGGLGLEYSEQQPERDMSNTYAQVRV